VGFPHGKVVDVPKTSQAAKDKQRKRILDAARVCIERKGVEKTTIREVIAQSGKSSGAVYLYFKNRQDIFAGILEELSVCLLMDFRELPRQGTIAAYSKEAGEVWMTHVSRAHFFLILESVNDEMLRKIWSDTIRALLALMSVSIERIDDYRLLEHQGFGSRALARMLFMAFMGSLFGGEYPDAEGVREASLSPFIDLLNGLPNHVEHGLRLDGI
jgi:AcrR family transcriptional regulator